MPRSAAPRDVPSWPTVIRTTIRLWLERRRAGTRRRRRLVLAATACCVAAAIAVVALSLGFGRPAGQRDTVRRDAAARTYGQDALTAVAIALHRAEAAEWIAQQVSPGTIVACDPEMCSVLAANGLPAAGLLTLPGPAADLRGAGIVVATPAVRATFGARLASGYAPEVIASFGSGANETDVRAVAPDGAAAFEAGLPADQAGRISAGQQLLRNKHVRVPAAARAALTAGDVDPRLLTALAALAAEHRVTIASFDDPSPGVSSVPLRGAEIGPAARGALRPLLSFLRAQRSPYLPAQVVLVPAGHGKYLLSVQYDAPGPLGLTNGH